MSAAADAASGPDAGPGWARNLSYESGPLPTRRIIGRTTEQFDSAPRRSAM